MHVREGWGVANPVRAAAASRRQRNPISQSPARLAGPLAGPLLDPASTGDGIGNLEHGGCSASWQPGASLSLCCQPRDFRGGEGGRKYSEDRTVDTVQYCTVSDIEQAVWLEWLGHTVVTDF
jgi:hypothetical protein